MYKITWYTCIRIWVLLSYDHTQLFLLLFFSFIRLLMNNNQTNVNHDPHYFFPYFYYKTVFKLNFKAFIHYSNFSIITNLCTNNDQHNDLCHVSWSLDFVSTKSFGSGKKPFVRDLNHVIMAIEHWGFVRVPHLLWNGASIYKGHLGGLVTLTPVAVRFAVELSVPVITTWVSGDRGLNFDLSHARRRSTSDPPRRRLYCYEQLLISRTLHKMLTRI